ncbi:DUF6745 domain-containing protein [Streptomyces sp. W16]|uniref:DUF6745 domain-containing protein n=1 Tax=Streptomyces sp. W16 TaxID=3076631 RepID=UPI003FA3BEE6
MVEVLNSTPEPDGTHRTYWLRVPPSTRTARAGGGPDEVAVVATVRRRHIVRDELGNLYDGSHRAALRRRACPPAVCDCRIGHVHLKSLPLYDIFAGGVVERVPSALPGRGTARALPITARSMSGGGGADGPRR